MCPPLPRVGFLTVDNCVALVCAVIARRAVGQRFDAVAVVIRHPLGDVRLALGEKCVLLCEFSFSLCVCMLVSRVCLGKRFGVSYTYENGRRTAETICHLCIKTNILPRQARDKHRETSKKNPRCPVPRPPRHIRSSARGTSRPCTTTTSARKRPHISECCFPNICPEPVSVK